MAETFGWVRGVCGIHCFGCHHDSFPRNGLTAEEHQHKDAGNGQTLCPRTGEVHRYVPLSTFYDDPWHEAAAWEVARYA